MVCILSRCSWSDFCSEMDSLVEMMLIMNVVILLIMDFGRVTAGKTEKPRHP